MAPSLPLNTLPTPCTGWPRPHLLLLLLLLLQGLLQATQSPRVPHRRCLLLLLPQSCNICQP
jgi:hypothetical protein